MRDDGGVLELILDDVEVADGSSQHRQGVPTGSYCGLCYRDTGAGIEKVIIDRIFDPFFTTKIPSSPLKRREKEPD